MEHVEPHIIVWKAEAGEYAALFPRPVTVFDRVDFAALNAAKADEVEYLVIMRADGTPLMGWIVGRCGSCRIAPFSAPYSLPVLAGKVPDVEEMLCCMRALRRYAAGGLRLTLPPDFYAPDFLPALKAALSGAGAVLRYTDYNYHALTAAAADPAQMPRRTARQEARRALADPSVCYVELDAASAADVERAYGVISANHRAKGHPVKMSLAQVIETIALLGGYVSVVTVDGHDAAAQLGYFSAGHVYQPVYWGDLPQYTHKHPMKALFCNLCESLSRTGAAQLLDLGPSSERGVPSVGLCAFKSSLGCKLTLKPTFEFPPEL